MLIVQIMEEVLKVLQSIQGELAQQKQDMKNMEENIKEAINKNIDEKFNCIEIKTNQLEKKIEQQQRTIDFLDRQIRKKNLLFFGVEETEKNYDDLLMLILDIINTKMGVLCQRWEIETVTRIGKNNGRTRPVVVTITTTSRKLELLRKKKALENTNIYIKEDYSPAVLQKRKELQEELKRERESGKMVALRYDKIVTLNSQKSVYQTSKEKNPNKRLLSESPKSVNIPKTSCNEERIKQVQKKNKPQNITNYLRPSQLNPIARPSTSRDVQENQANTKN